MKTLTFFILLVFGGYISTTSLGCYTPFNQKTFFGNLREMETKRMSMVMENKAVEKLMNDKVKENDKIRDAILELSLNVSEKNLVVKYFFISSFD